MTLLTMPDQHSQDQEVHDTLCTFKEKVGEIPLPLEMMAISPSLFNVQMGQIRYFSNHDTLSFGLLTCIRYLTAKKLNFSACIDFNQMLLGKLGLQPEDIEQLETDTTRAQLEEKEEILLRFVIDSLDNAISEKEMAKLRNLGWKDRDIYESVSHSYSMIPMGKMISQFQFSNP